jgi:hypothetical protein
MAASLPTVDRSGLQPRRGQTGLFTPVVSEANPVSLSPSVAKRPFNQLVWRLDLIAKPNAVIKVQQKVFEYSRLFFFDCLSRDHQNYIVAFPYGMTFACFELFELNIGKCVLSSD